MEVVSFVAILFKFCTFYLKIRITTFKMWVNIEQMNIFTLAPWCVHMLSFLNDSTMFLMSILTHEYIHFIALPL